MANKTITDLTAATLPATGTELVHVVQGANSRKLALSSLPISDLAAAAIASVVRKGHVFGLALSTNATDAANDIDVAIGEAASDASPPVLISLASVLTKRLDASWAVGSNSGMLDTGSVANNTYFIHLIRRSDTGVVDVLASLSATAPTMPTSYDQKRLIGYLVRASAINSAPVMYAQPETQIVGAAPVFPCRAWVNFAGATGAIRASGNVSSVTRNGAGDYTINFAAALPDANYSVIGSASYAGGPTIVETNTAGNSASGGTASAIRIAVRNAISNTLLDSSFVSVAIFR